MKRIVKQEEVEDFTEKTEVRNRRHQKEEDKKRDRSKPSNRPALPLPLPSVPEKSSKKRARKDSPPAPIVKDEHPSKRLSKNSILDRHRVRVRRGSDLPGHVSSQLTTSLALTSSRPTVEHYPRETTEALSAVDQDI